jgi:spermidine synthase
MTDENSTIDHATSAVPRLLPLLLLLFFGSGCAALIYEIVWFQLLQLVIGSTAVSLGVLLGTFMGGMCLGSFALPRVVSAREHPLRVYALMEAAIGLIAILVLVGMPAIAGLYAAAVGYGLPGILLRAIVCGLCLLPPTLLMGATLPAISRWIETTPQGVSWLGFFYGGNIAGAVLGSLLAGFYLLRLYGAGTATLVAVAINAAVAGIAFTLARRTPYQAAVVVPAPRPAAPDASTRLVYATIALSGMSALGAEVVWTRLLSLMLGPTVYTFCIILAVFLVGLGIGSSAGSYLSRRTESPRVALAWCQMLLALAIAWCACMLTRSIPFWPINPALSRSPGLTFQIDLVRCLWAILPAACLWGASFPLALAGAASRGQDPGRLVGGVYAANTVGAIVGALGFSLLVIPTMGTQQAQRLLIGLAATAAVLALASFSQQRSSLQGKPLPLASRAAGAAPVAIFTAVVAFLIWSVAPIPPGTVGYGRSILTYPTLPKFLFIGEGMNSTVAVSEWPGGMRTFHVAGKVEATSAAIDMRLQVMLGDIPALLHPQPHSALVVGFGAGVTAGSFLPYPDIQRVVICEIEPLIPKVVSRYFGPQNRHVRDDPRTQVIYDDARHFILTTREKFDIITSDPIHPWVRGSATLYTKEYFELVRRHLNPGGLVTQWVPLYETSSDVVKSEIATFMEVFPHTSIWATNHHGEGYDLVLLGKADVLEIDLNQIQERANQPRYSGVLTALTDAGFDPPVDLLSTFAGQASDLRPWLANAEINRDRDLRLQYLAGFQLNLYQGEPIYREILKYRKFPGDLFVGSDDLKQLVTKAMTASRQNP